MVGVAPDLRVPRGRAAQAEHIDWHTDSPHLSLSHYKRSNFTIKKSLGRKVQMKDKDFEARSKGGKNRWANVSKEKRSKILSKAGKSRWNRKDENNTPETKERDTIGPLL